MVTSPRVIAVSSGTNHRDEFSPGLPTRGLPLTRHSGAEMQFALCQDLKSAWTVLPFGSTVVL